MLMPFTFRFRADSTMAGHRKGFTCMRIFITPMFDGLIPKSRARSDLFGKASRRAATALMHMFLQDVETLCKPLSCLR